MSRSPLQELTRLFQSAPDGHLTDRVAWVETQFRSTLGQRKLPPLTAATSPFCTYGMLVRYRCMIQDMASDLELCQVGVTTEGSTLYNEDHSGIAPTESGYLERETYHCTPVPGEAAWVAGYGPSDAPQPSDANAASAPQRKHPRVEIEEEQKKRRLEDPTEIENDPALAPLHLHCAHVPIC
eukprot:NODE_5131_length_694_cov_20.216931_g4968_i0.p1 GENE.NODE_5131_length_694_cov_20.216931_g4968_i0~~NODE_5131_length_694_cov_20.216931_g4968_i0.p1  ORF type:complete len:182 (-),score=22.20 NODE_5131_length_694_cov_20.216931_g4968_i0:148-693(-)